MKQEQKRKLLITLIVVFALVIIGAVGYVVIKQLGLFSSEETYREVQQSYVTTAAATAAETITDPANTDETGFPVNNPIDFENLRAQNPDVYSWIDIPDTNVHYPVLQSTEDDNFYLDHDVYKNYSFPGAIYSQSMNKKDYSDRVTVLYGHNMLNGSMFATIYRFADAQFFEEHPYFYVYTADRKLTYEVVSAFDYDDRHILNSFNFNEDSVFSDWLTAAQSPHSLYSNVRTDVKLDLNSKMLVLSTCTNSGDGRYLLQGVLIKDEQTR